METGVPAQSEQRSLLPTGLIAIAFVVVAVIFCSTANWYLTLKAVHVGFSVIWIGGGFLLMLLGVIAERQNDAEGLAAIAKQAALVSDKLFAPSALVVVAAGIAMMLNTDWGWDHFWITAGLLGFASTFIIGVFVLTPRSKQLDALMRTAGPTAPETQAAIKSMLLIARVDIAVLLLVVVDMVVKPFS